VAEEAIGLQDIAPDFVTVRVKGEDRQVTGISLQTIFGLVRRFPQLQPLLELKELTPMQIVEVAPDAIGAILAAGFGKPGDLAAEKDSETIAVGRQMQVFDAIWKLTFVDVGGFQGFLQRMFQLGILRAGSPAGKGNGSATPSPREPPSSLGADIPQEPSGATPLAS